MSGKLSITNNLGQVIPGLRITESTKAEIANVIVETYARWFFGLKGPTISAPGEGEWPVGRVINLGRENERYVTGDPDPPLGAVSSGRSLGAWRPVQRGLNIVAINDAVDARRRFYPPYIHKAGKPTGDAARRAWELWTQEFQKSRPDFERVIKQGIDRGN